MIIAFTGAGISKASGIPTFCDQEQLRQKLSREYADRHPIEYYALIRQIQHTCINSEPNDAHRALAEYKIPIITMNIDGLHQRAAQMEIQENKADTGHVINLVQGQSLILPIHGTIPNIILYGDEAPLYKYAEDLISNMEEGKDILLVVGVSSYTLISRELLELARKRKVNVHKINANASVMVRMFIEKNEKYLEDFDTFMSR